MGEGPPIMERGRPARIFMDSATPLRSAQNDEFFSRPRTFT